MSKGFSDKLYWRVFCRVWHCFKKVEGGGYISLCGAWELQKSSGQSCSRPAAVLRCAPCDVREMERRGWTESGPAALREVKEV